ncbi:MAG: ABC transporter permease, partial [Gammaproteobacteria bacterium]
MLWNAFILALREIRRNVLRSFLTILGIVIGVAAVIIMVTLGEGATLQVSQQIASLGSNLLTIRPGQSLGFGGSVAAPFKLEDVQALRQIHAVEAATPYSSTAITAIYGNANLLTSVAGIDNDFFKVRDWKIVSGRQFTDSELRAGKAVCILGETVRKQLFNQQQALSSQIRLQK